MTWILFIIVSSYQGPAISNAEFSNYDSCIKAAKTIGDITKRNYSNSEVICVHKGTGETK